MKILPANITIGDKYKPAMEMINEDEAKEDQTHYGYLLVDAPTSPSEDDDLAF